jgi:hypothetical protein
MTLINCATGEFKLVGTLCEIEQLLIDARNGAYEYDNKELDEYKKLLEECELYEKTE